MLDPRIAPHTVGVTGRLVQVSAVTLAATGASVGAAFLLADTTSRLLTEDPRGPWTPLAWAVALLVVRAVLLWLRDVLALRTGTAVARQIRRRLYDHILRLGPGHQWPGGAARAHVVAVDGCEHIRGYVGSYLPQAIASVAVPSVLLVVIGAQDLGVAALIAVMLLAVPFGQRYTSRLLGQRAAVHWAAYEAYGAKVSDSVAGLATLAGLGASSRRSADLAREADELRAATTATMNVSLTSYVVTGAAMLLGTSGATLLAAWHAAEGTLPAGAVVLVLFLAVECFRPLQELANYWHEGFYGLAAAAAVGAILDTPPPVADAPDVRRAAWLDDRPGPPGFELRGVRLRYPGATHDALADVTAHVPAGRTTALVGLSGSGKTTFTALLLRDRDPDAGEVVLDVAGRQADLRTLPLAQLRRLCARVTQDVVLFDGTIRQNLVDASGREVAAADLDDVLRQSQVTEFLPQLPDGLDSPVGEGGRRLSGGQRQRIALARALLQDAALLVLDEATSALDGENEALVTAALHAHAGERTVVVIAHRLSTVAAADHVIVLDAGRVVEEGPPDQLEARGGAWAAMMAQHREAVAACR